jgi:hypothetical protein
MQQERSEEMERSKEIEAGRMKPGIVWVKEGRKGEGFRMFKEYLNIKDKKGHDRILVIVGRLKYTVTLNDIRRFPDADC